MSCFNQTTRIKAIVKGNSSLLHKDRLIINATNNDSVVKSGGCLTCEQLLALPKMMGGLAFGMSRNAKLFCEINCFKQEKLMYEVHISHRSAWAAIEEYSFRQVYCCSLQLAWKGHIQNCDLWDSHPAFYFLLWDSEKAVGETDGTCRCYEFYWWRFEIESQDKVKKQEWCCHVGKQSSEKGNRLGKWSFRGDEEEFAY